MRLINVKESSRLYMQRKVEEVANEHLTDLDALKRHLDVLMTNLEKEGVISYWHFLTDIYPDNPEILMEVEFEEKEETRLVEIKISWNF